jgi:hypothetical protein
MNTLEHFKGNHTGCPLEHPKLGRWKGVRSEQAETELSGFLQRTLGLVTRTCNRFDTQMCESFNAVTAHFARKQISWKVRWSLRVVCAVMQTNCDEDWRIPLAARCGIEVSDDVKQKLEARYATAIAWNAVRRTPEAQKNKKKPRIRKRYQDKKNKAGASDYHMPRGETERERDDTSTDTEETADEAHDALIEAGGEPNGEEDEPNEEQDGPIEPGDEEIDPDGPDAEIEDLPPQWKTYEEAVRLDPRLAEFGIPSDEDTEVNFHWVPPPGRRCREVGREPGAAADKAQAEVFPPTTLASGWNWRHRRSTGCSLSSRTFFQSHPYPNCATLCHGQRW